MIIKRHYSSRPEDQEFVIRALVLVLKILDGAGGKSPVFLSD